MRIKAINGKKGIGTGVKDATYVEAAWWGKYRWWRYLLGLMIILFAWMVLANFASALVALALSGEEGIAALTRLDYAAFGPIGGFVVVMAGFPVFLFNWSGSFFTTPALFSISEYHARFYDITSIVLIPVFLVIVVRVFKRDKASEAVSQSDWIGRR